MSAFRESQLSDGSKIILLSVCVDELIKLCYDCIENMTDAEEAKILRAKNAVVQCLGPSVFYAKAPP